MKNHKTSNDDAFLKVKQGQRIWNYKYTKQNKIKQNLVITVSSRLQCVCCWNSGTNFLRSIRLVWPLLAFWELIHIAAASISDYTTLPAAATEQFSDDVDRKLSPFLSASLLSNDSLSFVFSETFDRTPYFREELSWQYTQKHEKLCLHALTSQHHQQSNIRTSRCANEEISLRRENRLLMSH